MVRQICDFAGWMPTAARRNALKFGTISRYRAPMDHIGKSIDETGTLIRDGAGFYLRLDLGGQYALELRRVPVDFIEKRVRVVGRSGGQRRGPRGHVRRVPGDERLAPRR